MRHRYDVLTRITAMDPVRDHLEIYRLTVTHEFPWDMNQALSFALFRTYAVPTIGQLLADTGEFTERVQKRYDDTGLVLDAVLEHGPDSALGKAAIRRMNQMHRSYDISDDDMRYVLCTFVVTPIRWMERYAWRPLSGIEKIASAEYYTALGRRMGIKDIPATWQEFARVHDAYEAEHFAWSEGGRAVADSTLALLGTFPRTTGCPQRSCGRPRTPSWTTHCAPPSATPRRTRCSRRPPGPGCAPAGSHCGSPHRGRSPSTPVSGPPSAATRTATTSPRSAPSRPPARSRTVPGRPPSSDPGQACSAASSPSP